MFNFARTALSTAAVLAVTMAYAQAQPYSFRLNAQGVRVASAPSQPTNPGTPTTPTSPTTPTPAPAPRIELSASVLDFEGVELGQSATRALQLENVGTGLLELGVPLIDGGEFIATTNCPATLAAGTSCVTNVTFTPTTLDVKTSELRIESNSPTTPDRVRLQGQGLQAIGTLTAVTGTDFGMVDTGTTQSRSFTFTNSGNRAATIAANLTGANLSMTANDCGTAATPVSLAAKTSCSITVRYAPTAPAASIDGTLQVTGNFKNSPASLTLTGSARTAAEVVLMMHGEGTNGSTVFTDSSPLAKTYTKGGTAASVASISTARARFGTGSLYFDGNGAYVTNADAFKLGSGDFTIEFWEYRTAEATGTAQGNAPIAGAAWTITHLRPGYADMGLTFCAVADRNAGGGNNCNTYASTVSTGSAARYNTLNAWQHVAVTRQNKTYRIYVNGQLVASNTLLGGDMENGGAGRINIGLSGFIGFIDELRVTKGVARYTGANFPLQTAPHSNN